MTDAGYIIRRPKKGDRAFVLSNWKRTWVGSVPMLDMVVPSAYFSVVNQVFDALYDRSEMRVACDPEKLSYILGWVLYEDDCVHYCYTKGVYRGLGVQDKLFDVIGADAMSFCSFITEDGGRLVKKYGLEYQPSLAMEKR